MSSLKLQVSNLAVTLEFRKLDIGRLHRKKEQQEQHTDIEFNIGYYIYIYEKILFPIPVPCIYRYSNPF